MVKENTIMSVVDDLRPPIEVDILSTELSIITVANMIKIMISRTFSSLELNTNDAILAHLEGEL